MILAHLPAGYILTKKLQEKFKTRKYLLVGLIGSVFPDFDVFYFYWLDHRQHLHHSYWTHLPFDWVVIGLLTVALLYGTRKKEYRLPAGIFLSNIFLHFLLDTIVGKIEWLYPFTDTSYFLFDIPSTHDFWVFNFIFHWTFLFELAIIGWALLLYHRNKRRGTSQARSFKV